MIEMLGVLAVIGVLSVGGIMGYSTAMENYKVNKWVNDISNMAIKFDTVFQKSAVTGESAHIGYMQASLERLYQAKVIDLSYYATKSSSHKSFLGLCRNYPYSLTAMESPFGTDFAAFYSKQGGGKYLLLAFIVNDLPKSACVKILSHNWEGSKIKAFSLGTCHLLYAPLSPTEAQKECVVSQDYGISLAFLYYTDYR